MPSAWATTMPGRVTTKYEGKAGREGRDCYYFAYRRGTLPPPAVPVIQELAMPHIVFKTPLSLEAMWETFESGEQRVGDTFISLLHCYRGKNTLLVEVYVKEPTIDQRVALMVTPREQPQEFTLKLGVLGHPRPTAGIHQATAIVGDWLLSLHPAARVLQRKVQAD
jgi:hypothetical protein